LIDNKPAQEQAVAAWRRALIAMAQRVPSRSAIDGDRRLLELRESATIREPFLSGALERYETPPQDTLNPSSPQTMQATGTPSAKNDMIELLLARAEVRLATDPAGAEADYSRIAASRHPLSPSQRERHDEGLLRARLAT